MKRQLEEHEFRAQSADIAMAADKEKLELNEEKQQELLSQILDWNSRLNLIQETLDNLTQQKIEQQQSLQQLKVYYYAYVPFNISRKCMKLKKE